MRGASCSVQVEREVSETMVSGANLITGTIDRPDGTGGSHD